MSIDPGIAGRQMAKRLNAIAELNRGQIIQALLRARDSSTAIDSRVLLEQQADAVLAMIVPRIADLEATVARLKAALEKISGRREYFPADATKKYGPVDWSPEVEAFVDYTLSCPHPSAPVGYKMVPVDDETTLAECPVGLFMSDGGDLCFKTEGACSPGQFKAYLIKTGEFFWGSAPQTIASQREQRVRPVTFAAAPTPPTASPVEDADETENQTVSLNGRCVTLSGLALEVMRTMDKQNHIGIKAAFQRGYRGGVEFAVLDIEHLKRRLNAAAAGLAPEGGQS